MKKIILIALMMAVAGLAYSQKTRLNLYSGYVFDDGIDSYYDSYNYYDGKITGGYQWGVGLEYSVHPEYGIELMYFRQDTDVPLTYQSGTLGSVAHETFDLSMNYIMIGGTRRAGAAGGRVEGYGGLMLGCAIADVTNPTNNSSQSATKFAWGGRLGCNIWMGASGRVGIKLQALLLSAVQSAGGGLYFGTGGAGLGLSTYSSMYQFGLGGGLTFKFGK